MWAVNRIISCGVFLLAGCAASAPSPEQEAAEQAALETVEQILSAPLDATEYAAEPERCISTYMYDSMEVLDDRHVLFKGRGGKLWLNQLRSRCVGLRQHSIPVIRLRDSQVCDMDTFQAMDSMLGVWQRTSAHCSLGTFTPITPEQADTVRAALDEARRKP